jgi:hypothetical protein
VPKLEPEPELQMVADSNEGESFHQANLDMLSAWTGSPVGVREVELQQRGELGCEARGGSSAQ